MAPTKNTSTEEEEEERDRRSQVRHQESKKEGGGGRRGHQLGFLVSPRHNSNRIVGHPVIFCVG